MRRTALLGLVLALAGCVPPLTENMRRGIPAPDSSTVNPPPTAPVATPATPSDVGYGAALPRVPKSGIGAEAPAPTPPLRRVPTIAAQPGVPPATAPRPGTAGQSISVPNGNGTTTVIHPDGTVETIPTPK